jgi:hypothetical protein
MRDLLANGAPGAALAADHFVHRSALHAVSLAAFVFTADNGDDAAPASRPPGSTPRLLPGAVDSGVDRLGADCPEPGLEA